MPLPTPLPLCSRHFDSTRWCYNLQLLFGITQNLTLNAGITSVQLWADDATPGTNPVYYTPMGVPTRVPGSQFLSGSYNVTRTRVCDLNRDGSFHIALHALSYACGCMAGACMVCVWGSGERGRHAGNACLVHREGP